MPLATLFRCHADSDLMIQEAEDIHKRARRFFSMRRHLKNLCRFSFFQLTSRTDVFSAVSALFHAPFRYLCFPPSPFVFSPSRPWGFIDFLEMGQQKAFPFTRPNFQSLFHPPVSQSFFQRPVYQSMNWSCPPFRSHLPSPALLRRGCAQVDYVELRQTWRYLEVQGQQAKTEGRLLVEEMSLKTKMFERAKV